MAHSYEKNGNPTSEIEVDPPIPAEQGQEQEQPRERSDVQTSDGAEVEASAKWNSKSSSNYLRVLWDLLIYTPQRCRWDPANPVKFSWGLTFLFAFATTFTVGSSSFPYVPHCFLSFFLSLQIDSTQLFPFTKQKTLVHQQSPIPNTHLIFNTNKPR